LDYAIQKWHSETIKRVLATLMEKFNGELKTHIDIPMALVNGKCNRRRQESYHWLLSKRLTN
jgi:hypothetical protein